MVIKAVLLQGRVAQLQPWPLCTSTITVNHATAGAEAAAAAAAKVEATAGASGSNSGSCSDDSSGGVSSGSVWELTCGDYYVTT